MYGLGCYTLAPSHVANCSLEAGYAAREAESRKVQKYAGQLPTTYEFIPLGFETLGAAGPSATEFLGLLGHRLVEVTGNIRAGEFLMQRLSIEILRGNAGSILGSLENDSTGVELETGMHGLFGVGVVDTVA